MIDLSDENITELKLPDEIANQPEQEAQNQEAAVDTTEKMAQNAANIVSALFLPFIHWI